MSIPPGGIDPDEYYTTDPGIPFHLVRRKKATQPPNISLVGSNQSSIRGLEEAFSKFTEKNIKDGLSNFLPHLPGYVDAPGTPQDSLQALIEKPPIGGRELAPLSESSLQGFRLMPGSVPEQFKFLNKPPEKKKKKKHKHHEEPPGAEGAILAGDSSQDKKHKKRKKEEGGEKKKKEKKKKKKKDKKGDQDD